MPQPKQIQQFVLLSVVNHPTCDRFKQFHPSNCGEQEQEVSAAYQ